MNYNNLMVFYKVATAANISKAARELNVTQPAVSRIITTLEEEYKTTLFRRNKNGVVLTKEGLKLFQMIKDAYFQLSKVEITLKDKDFFSKKIVNIGTTPISLDVYLFSFLEELKVNFPGVTFRIYTGSSKRVLELLEKNQVDFAFITTPYNIKEHIKTIDVKRLDNILVAPISYKDRLSGKVSIKDIADLPFVLLNDKMQFREHLNKYFLENNVNIVPAYEPDSSNLLLSFVEKDCGLSFIPPEMAEQSIKHGLCFKVDLIEKVPLRHVSFALNSNSTHSIVTHQIKEIVEYSASLLKKKTIY